MKNFKYIVTTCLFTAVTFLSYSQTRPIPRKQGMNQMQMQVLIRHLQLEESQKAKFSELYIEYQNELENLRPKPENDNMDDRGVLSDQEIENRIIESFDVTERNIELKRKYYFKFKEILSLPQIYEMYNVERQINKRITDEFKRRNDVNRKN